MRERSRRRPRAIRHAASREAFDRASAGPPRVGVGAVVIRDGEVLLVRRANPPLRGRWMIPGGMVECGESLEKAVVREVREETGLVVRPREPLAIFEQVQCEGGRVVHHYVIVDFLCDYVSGTPVAGSDAREVAMVTSRALSTYRLTRDARRVVLEGWRRTATGAGGARVAEKKRGR